MDQQTRDLLSAYFDELSDRVSADVKKGAFNNDEVLWIVKAWTKIVTIATSGGAYLVELCQVIIRDTPPPKSGFTDSKKSFNRNLGDYQEMFARGTADGDPRADVFKQVDNPLKNMVSEYRKSIGKDGKKDKEFIHQILVWQNFGRIKVEDLSKEAGWRIFKMDQSA